MNPKLVLSHVLLACLAFPFVGAHAAFGQSSPAGLRGIIRDSATGKPVAEAQITAHNVDNGVDRTTTSGEDGVFSIANLEPGRYEVTAIKEGFQKSSLMLRWDRSELTDCIFRSLPRPQAGGPRPRLLPPTLRRSRLSASLRL